MSYEYPFVHLMKVPFGYYVYDVNTGQTLKVDKNVYDYLENPEKEVDEETLNTISTLKRNGYLRSNHVITTEHPYSELLPYALQTRLGNLILQVTQNCNLRCEYCVYSGNYDTRGHTNKRMTFEVAKKAIDYFVDHSKERNKIFIGFYGGEPLLEFELIKKCVEYINNICDGKDVGYIMTTNGTLITDEMIDFFIEHEFRITISVDGPREIHNRSRVFANREEGSFDTMIKNIERIKLKSNKYYNDCVKFNTVMLAQDGVCCLERYFHGDELFADAYFSANIVSSAYTDKKREVPEKFVIEQQYELFKLFLNKFGRLDSEYTPILLNDYFAYIKKEATVRKQTGRQALPEKWHRGGPCIPGVTRLFVTVEGDILPCERVCEIANISKIGSIYDGIDNDKANRILNLEHYTEDICHDCWAYSECSTCIQCCDSKDDTIRKNILKNCKKVKYSVENAMMDAIVLTELGYDLETKSLIGEAGQYIDEELYNV